MELFNTNYNRYMLIPLFLGIIFLVLAFIYPGLEKGIDLKGGNQIIVHYDDSKDYSTIEPLLLEKFNLSEVSIVQTKNINEYGLTIQFSLQKDIQFVKDQKSKIDFKNTDLDFLKNSSKDILMPLVNKGFLVSSDLEDIDYSKTSDDIKQSLVTLINLANTNFNNSVINIISSELSLGENPKIQTREVAPTLGSDFIKSSVKAGIIAFTLLILVILLFFREIVPSGLIIFAALFDILAALAGMSIFNLPLSLTTIPALLMLIGYSVDTDIMLSSRLLKDKSKNPIFACNESIKTGLTMTFTTMSTVIVMLIISYLSQITVIFEISIILLCGLIGDLISTWFFNAPALINYVKKKQKN
ncbi:MAG: hypothetical protein PHR26_01330 [Candidatus ainarchaeum sp.]|nr:hypothetical protein [Candidatus ainarchaeum sp.]MDD3975833.1 hypothetical protein [Candidatus ainarchaeum sp.]